MVEVQKEERKGNQGDERFIQRMYMRNIADIWTDIRIADIILNGSNICSTADIPELGDICEAVLNGGE